MSSIPTAFGGFAPFPNTIMIPTMGLQSDVIGFRFGFGYEKGKRTLRAMSNEQFNTLNEEAEQAIYKEHDTTAINFFKMEMIKWVELQTIIIEKSVEIETMKAQRTPSAFREIFEGFTKGFTKQQSEDAGNFFQSLTDPIMKLMAWFSGHSGSGQATVPSAPITPTTGRVNPREPIQPIPTPSQGINSKITQTDVSRGLPRAGQSAIIQRNSLIKKIAMHSNAIKIWQNKVTRNQADRNRQKLMIETNQRLMSDTQKELVVLLNRYRWL